MAPWWILSLVLAAWGSGASRLYSGTGPVVVLDSSSLRPALRNSSTAWTVQFFSSWCGHCIQYSPTWKALAQDVSDWDQVIRVGVLDCAQEDNLDICKDYSIQFYPTFRLFRAHAHASDSGQTYRGADREVRTMRQTMVNFLQNQTTVDLPDKCPHLEPTSSTEILSLLGQRSDHYIAIIIEQPQSYVGREVMLDLVQFSGVEVRRALSTDLPLVTRLGITAFPSAYLLHPNGTHTHLHVGKRLRFFFTSFLRSLPGVQRRSSSSSLSDQQGMLQSPQTLDKWREFDSNKVYMADLESALHYLLRVELATHNTLEGEELKTFKDFVTVVAKLFPGRSCVEKLVQTLSEWLLSLPLTTIPYNAVLDLVNNKMKISGLFLGAELRWVGCQGSRAGLRGYPCSLWTLFHVLTVQHATRPHALANTGMEDDPRAVLQTMRRYIKTFFGCEDCGRHFEAMAAESLPEVKSPDQAVLWLWRKHNLVNNRLAGTLSEDPMFPKAPWPSPALCASCHNEEEGVHMWSEEKVLVFLKQHYGAANLSPKYTLTPPRLPSVPAGEAGGEAERRGEDPKHQPLKEDAKGVGGGQEGGRGGDQEGGRGGDQAGGRGGDQAGGRGGDQAGERRGMHGEVRQEMAGGVSILGVGFNSLDMSLCVFLYASSCLFLMLMFFFFKVRSRRWKIRHNRPYV